jgi:hypothetical protein
MGIRQAYPMGDSHHQNLDFPIVEMLMFFNFS